MRSPPVTTMRRSWVIAGAVVLVIGLLISVGGYAVNAGHRQTVVRPGSALVISPIGLAGGPFSGSWSGAPAGTTVYITTASNDCRNLSGIVSSSTGSDGSISASLALGTTYYVFGCSSGNPTAITMTYSYIGLSYFIALGIVLAVIGAILLGAGARSRPKRPAVNPGAPMPPTADAPPK